MCFNNIFGQLFIVPSFIFLINVVLFYIKRSLIYFLQFLIFRSTTPRYDDNRKLTPRYDNDVRMSRQMMANHRSPRTPSYKSPHTSNSE